MPIRKDPGTLRVSQNSQLHRTTQTSAIMERNHRGEYKVLLYTGTMYICKNQKQIFTNNRISLLLDQKVINGYHATQIVEMLKKHNRQFSEPLLTGCRQSNSLSCWEEGINCFEKKTLYLYVLAPFNGNRKLLNYFYQFTYLRIKI